VTLHYLDKAAAAASINPRARFGAVIANTSCSFAARNAAELDACIKCTNINRRTNLHYRDHGEKVAIDDCTHRYPNWSADDWKAMTLYTTGESCVGCIGDIFFRGIRRVRFGISVSTMVSQLCYRQLVEPHKRVMAKDSDPTDLTDIKGPFSESRYLAGFISFCAGQPPPPPPAVIPPANWCPAEFPCPTWATASCNSQ